MNASSFDQILRRVIVVPVVALLCGAAALAWQIHEANATVGVIQTCDDRIARTLVIEQFIVDQEAGLRGFEITRDPRFLQHFYLAEKSLPGAFAERRALASPSRQIEIDSIRQAYETWEQSFALPLINIVQAGGQPGDLALNYQGKQMMDNLRGRVQGLNSMTVQVRSDAVQRWHRQVRQTILALIIASLLIGLVIGLYVRRLLRRISGAFRESHNVLRIRAEQTFRSEEKLRTTLRSIGDGVITCDQQGCVQSMNDMAQEITGWSEAEARDQPIEQVFRLIDASSRDPLEGPVSKITRLNQVVSLASSAVLLRRDGSEIFIDESGAPIRDKHFRLIGIVLVFRDVTMARKSQEALLANEKLAVAGRLAATIAHEIHNPLDSVSNLLYLMDGGVGSEEERKHFLDLAKQEIARVTQISRAMLSLYRESRAPVEIDLKDMLESILLLMDSRFHTLGVDVTCDFPAPLTIHGFPAELRQVFTNLLTNAAEASGQGGHIAVRARETDASATHQPGVLVTIDDTGPGIPEGIRQNLFQPFFTTKGERGTGLGLWVSRGIINKHGGSIELDSSIAPEDHGTTVSVFLAVDPVIQAAPA